MVRRFVDAPAESVLRQVRSRSALADRLRRAGPRDRGNDPRCLIRSREARAILPRPHADAAQEAAAHALLVAEPAAPGDGFDRRGCLLERAAGRLERSCSTAFAGVAPMRWA